MYALRFTSNSPVDEERDSSARDKGEARLLESVLVDVGFAQSRPNKVVSLGSDSRSMEPVSLVVGKTRQILVSGLLEAQILSRSPCH